MFFRAFMRLLPVGLLILVGSAGIAVARVAELCDLQGRTLSAKIVSLRDGVLCFRRVDDFSLHYYPLDQLSPDSQQQLHEKMTAGFVPELKVVSLDRSRITRTDWKTYWGSYEKTISLNRIFNVKISSTSAFHKKVYIYVYWLKNEAWSYETFEATVYSGNDFDIIISEDGTRNVQHYQSLGVRYTEGGNVLEPVVVVKDKDLKVLNSWSNLKRLEDYILARTERDQLN